MFRDFKNYEVFEDGRIFSYITNKFLNPEVNHNGYLRVKLSDNDGKRKNYRVHRVVYEAVTGQPIPEGMTINHIDEDKTNNHISNLNLMTLTENNNYGTHNLRMRRTQSKPVAQYDKDGNLINVYMSSKEVHRQLGYCNSSINSCCNSKLKTAYNYIWKFLDIF